LKLAITGPNGNIEMIDLMNFVLNDDYKIWNMLSDERKKECSSVIADLVKIGIADETITNLLGKYFIEKKTKVKKMKIHPDGYIVEVSEE
jgi:hypothetical protein